MNDFDSNWISYTRDLKHPQNEAKIITAIKSSRRIVFVAKGRVGLATKMFMQRLSQMGYHVAHSEDLLIPQMGSQDLAIFVTASGSTTSSLAYIEIAKRCQCKTLAITFNANGDISKQCDQLAVYPQPKEKGLMKSYYEVGFIYIFERIISFLPMEQFVHTNFE